MPSASDGRLYVPSASRERHCSGRSGGCGFTSPSRPLATYNALFVPIFTMFGLLCLVMSALFRQATEMKAENDLTI